MSYFSALQPQANLQSLVLFACRLPHSPWAIFLPCSQPTSQGLGLCLDRGPSRPPTPAQVLGLRPDLGGCARCHPGQGALDRGPLSPPPPPQADLMGDQRAGRGCPLGSRAWPGPQAEMPTAPSAGHTQGTQGWSQNQQAGRLSGSSGLAFLGGGHARHSACLSLGRPEEGRPQGPPPSVSLSAATRGPVPW